MVKKIANIYIIVLMILFLLNNVVPFDPKEIYIGFLTFIAILLMIRETRGLTLLFSIVMISSGIVILLSTGVPIVDWLPLYVENMTLIILILFVPILAIPLGIGKYNVEVEKILNQLKAKPGFLYAGITSALFVLGSIINLGSLSVIHAVTENNGFPKGFLGRAYARGFTSAIIWSPFFASVFLIISTLDVPIGKFIMYSLSLGMVQLLISNLWFNVKEKRYIPFNITNAPVESVKRSKVVMLVIILGLLIGIILVSERMVQGNMSIMITVIVCTYSLIWSIFMRKTREFSHRTYQYLNRIVPDRVHEVLLFLTAGFFSGAISTTNFGSGIQEAFVKVSSVSVLLLVFIVMSITVLLSFVGIHQIVTITLFLASINLAEVGISNLTFALTLTCSWSISTLVSPITPVNIISSTMLHTKVTSLIKWNYQFAMILIVVYSFVIYMYHLLLFI